MGLCPFAGTVDLLQFVLLPRIYMQHVTAHNNTLHAVPTDNASSHIQLMIVTTYNCNR
jgi:hypothetical protein